MTLTEQQIEDLCRDFLDEVDEATGPKQMGLDEALEAWGEILAHLTYELRMRQQAAKDDLGL